MKSPPTPIQGASCIIMYVQKQGFPPRWENGDPPNPLKRRSFKGRGGLGRAAGAHGGAGAEFHLHKRREREREGVKALWRCLHQALLCLPSGAEK